VPTWREDTLRGAGSWSDHFSRRGAALRRLGLLALIECARSAYVRSSSCSTTPIDEFLIFIQGSKAHGKSTERAKARLMRRANYQPLFLFV
jgi:hypothetical protein